MSIIRLQGEDEKRKGIYYQVDSNDTPIGVGGMGQVFKGICVNEHNGATRPVAIKFMYDDLPSHVIERARREASIQLRNDNLVEMLGFIEIVETNQFGETHIRYHVVSELLTGVSLSDLLDGKTTDRNGEEASFAVKLLQDYKNDSEHFARIIVMNVLSGLMALHDAGYIHRDIDPSNIMITNDGHIKLIDFGIAKQMKTLTTNDKGLTVAGKFMGKPEYAAPELVLGDVQHQDQTTDIYAMGVLLYQCVVGHTPFEGPRHEVLEQQLKTKLPIDAVKNKTLRKIISKACEKKQNLRYQTTSQMRVDLETAESKPVQSSYLNVKMMATITAVVILLIGVGSLAFFYGPAPKDPPQTVASMNVSKDTPSTTTEQEPKAEQPPVVLHEEEAETKDETMPTSKPEPKATAKSEPKEEPKAAEKPEPKVAPQQPKQKQNEEPAMTKSITSKGGNLRYGSWSGRVSQGKPVGFGTLIFTSSATIRCSNGSTINAQAGDKISNAEFEDNGYLYQGTYIKTDGQTKNIMP